MVWQAHMYPQEALVGTQELRWIWTRVFHCGLVAQASWAQSRGPVTRVLLCLARVGWRAVSATLWRDHNGVDIDITHASPSLLLG
eukprot:8317917-Pyramimonas_sp.AAC.1